MIAALFVDPDGVYTGLPDVELWDRARDARLYTGPWPVVAHPPCARWCQLAPLIQAVHGHSVGDDDGCFESALKSVRKFGGVLEHPAGSYAWAWFCLPTPLRGAWASSLTDQGWATEVDRGIYGHRARKRTWLYAVGIEEVALDWKRVYSRTFVTDLGAGGSRPRGRRQRLPHVGDKEANATPVAFRDALLYLARSVKVPV